jgi:RNA polymerase sigma factor (sigma-70 family)
MTNRSLAWRLLGDAPVQQDQYGDAFESGYRATRRFLLAQGAPMEEAEEIAQAAWVRGWEYRSQLRDPGRVGFWVNSIARNLLHARFRGPLTSALENSNPSYTMNLEIMDLRRLMGGCAARDRALLEQSLQGYSAEELAREAGITPTGIRVRLLRIRQSLRERTAARP